jgi:multiple sugar transport system substrate-binding protein
MKRAVLACFVLLASASILFATGTSSEEAGVTTIRWAYWGGETRVRISQEAINIFELQHTDIRVNPEPSGGAGDHFVKVDTQLAGGAGPDIIQMGGNIPDYVSRGVLLPLERYAGTLLNTDVIDDSAIESGTLEGHLYGVSTGVTMSGLVYNKDLILRSGAPLPQPSMTYTELAAYLEVLKDGLPAGVYPMQDIGAMTSNSTPFGYWLRYNGTPIYDADTNTTGVAAAAATEYLERFAEWREAGLVPPPDIAGGFA